MMALGRLACLGAIFLYATAGCSIGEAIAWKSSLKISLGYYSGGQPSYDAMVEFTGSLTAVSIDSIAVNASGDLIGGVREDIVPYGKASGLRTYVCISNNISEFNSDIGHAAIDTYKSKVIAKVLEVAKSSGVDGVNVDFENLYVADRDLFTQFIVEMAAALHAEGLELVISVPGKTSDNPGSTWSWSFDFASLGRSADLIQLMTYDQHGPWDKSDPGPVSGLDWVEKCVQYAVSVVDPAKLLIGLPAYGYDWNMTAKDASGFKWKDVPGILSRTGATPEWDAESSSPHIHYTENENNHEAWFENQESITAKAHLVKKYGLAGLSMWSLGQEDAGFWQAAIAGMK